MQEQKRKKGMFLSKMPFDECSAAMGFQVKEIKRQSHGVTGIKTDDSNFENLAHFSKILSLNMIRCLE